MGKWFVQALAEQEGASFQLEKKFDGQATTIKANLPDRKIHLLLPTTYMNVSGQSVSRMVNFFKLSPNTVLVVHDDLDLPPGIVRIKRGGSDGGHNGLRDVTKALGTPDYARLRIGIGHPGHRDRVLDYVLSKPSLHDRNLIRDVIDQTLTVWPIIREGNFDQALQQLPTR